jgi:hypothetical protein
VKRWSVPPVDIQHLHLQYLLQATEHGKMILPTLLLHFRPLAVRLTKLSADHLIFMYRMVLDIARMLGTDSEARVSALKSITHNVDQTCRLRLVPLSTNQT